VVDEGALEAPRAQALEVQVLEVQVLGLALRVEAQVLVLPVPDEGPVGPVSVAAATRLQLHVEAAVRPFRA